MVSAGFDLYVPGQSWLHRLDPRVKLLGVLGGTVLLLAWGNLALLLFVLAGLHGLLLTARVPGERFRWAWGVLLPVTVMIPLLWPLFGYAGGPVLWAWGPVRVGALDLLQGVAMTARVAALAFLYFVWLFTTDQTRLVRGFVRLGLPYAWGLTLTIALRYLPTFYGAYLAVRDAQQARGLVLGVGHPLRRLQGFLPILTAVIIQALRTTENLTRALEARGFGAPYPRTCLREIRMRLADWLVLAGLLACLGVLLGARLAWGFGAPLLSLW